MDNHLRVFRWFLDLRKRDPELFRTLIDMLRDDERRELLDDRWKDWPATFIVLVMAAGIVAGHWLPHMI
jgi:hypothetical protein